MDKNYQTGKWDVRKMVQNRDYRYIKQFLVAQRDKKDPDLLPEFDTPFYTELYSKDRKTQVKPSNTDQTNIQNFFRNIVTVLYTKEFKNQSQHLPRYQHTDLDGIKYIEKLGKYHLPINTRIEHNQLFLNSQKKSTYLKKEIIKNLSLLFNEKIEDQKKLTPEVYDNLQETIIGQLDELTISFPEEVEYAENMLLMYYTHYLRIDSVEYIDSVFTLGNILMHLSRSSTMIQKSSFFVNKIYALIEDESYPTRFLSNYLTIYLKNYFDERTLPSGGSIERHHIAKAAYELKISDEDFIQELEYMAYFLKAVIENSTIENEKHDMPSYLMLIDQYMRINTYIQKFYFNTKTSTLVSNTISTEYKELLSHLQKEILNTFFAIKEETEDQPMTLAQKLPRIEEIQHLEKSINNMILFIEINSENKTDVLKQELKTFKDTYHKYFNILQSYDTYIDSFIKNNQTLQVAQTRWYP